MKKRVSFITLGCKVNQYETNAMAQKFLEKGYKIIEEITPENEHINPDICIINTCTVTNMSDRKSRQMLRRMKEKNQNTIVVAVGCYAQVAKEELAKIPEIDLVLGNNEKVEIVKYVEEYLNNHIDNIKLDDVMYSKEFSDFGDVTYTEKTRAVIKIQDGCDRFCSYCIIPYARGRVRSRKPESILSEITQIASSTISEITHYTTVTIGPNTDEQKIENIKFVLLSPRMMMAVILTDNGLVKETIIKFDEDISEKQVGTLSYMFNNKLKGEPISKIDRPLEKYLVDEMKYSVNLIKPIIEQMKKVVEEEKVHLEGAKQLFELPEFNSLEVAKNFVNILDEKELMADMLNTGITKDINVYIGEENEKDELKDFSIVTFKHRIGNKDLGTIGIIGPKRMDYAKVISVMKYISKKLNDNNNSNE